MRSVNTATWMSAEPVSVGWIRFFSITSALASLVRGTPFFLPNIAGRAACSPSTFPLVVGSISQAFGAAAKERRTADGSTVSRRTFLEPKPV